MPQLRQLVHIGMRAIMKNSQKAGGAGRTVSSDLWQCISAKANATIIWHPSPVMLTIMLQCCSVADAVEAFPSADVFINFASFRR